LGTLPEADRSIAVNRKALHDFEVLSSLEAGLALTGTEIKSIREGRVNLRDAYARVAGGEAWLYNTHIAQYDKASHFNHDPLRRRKLLLHRDEIRELERQTSTKGLTLVPLRLYYKRGMAKLQLALVRGRKSYDKREAIADREVQRDIARALRRDA
jgi:SsrA-binding protein